MMRLVATECLLGELKPGDIYSIFQPKNGGTSTGGVPVFVRHNDPLPEEEAREHVYHLEVIVE